ncbi:hypothetical protein PG997_014973 [Apiospora hydei]|uniref:DUF7136 domain-containing protein n=1 Tax=Apiospora hydei TaxID=1337664 RepID=A0ABR1UVB2_9PEZI
MHTLSQAAALLAACAVGGVHAASPTSGILEVDLAFPRNQTYAPTARLPIVFAYQNPELATALRARVSFTVWNWDNMGNTTASANLDLGQANLSSRDPFLHYDFFPGFEAEGHYLLTWTAGWDNCTEESLGQTYTSTRIAHRTKTHSVLFTISNSAPAIDLVAATDNKDFVAESMPTPSPCRVQIDSAAASSMAASMTARACKYTQVVPPRRESSVRQRTKARRSSWL